ncbi:hypothetical protein [Microscilla marina]|uniref:Two-component hybrid sensor and regulator, putative n=1 Tax=Microscilla marina ATCC 23134 TaxID=313606 RepID=A1ZRF5_MICM2|nr:hypothetical protein [Microscilla marina]EAY27045.1 two-component hybrid sensor and regulator, putative [Microscilla marina ATCC 23134]
MSRDKSLIESLAEMGQDDPEFRKEMDALFIETLDEFLEAYKKGIQQASPEQLSFAIHKIKFAVKMYAIEDMYKAAEQGRQLVASTVYTPQQLAQCLDEVNTLCMLHRHKIAQRLSP